jgi:hypothetical protein
MLAKVTPPPTNKTPPSLLTHHQQDQPGQIYKKATTETHTHPEPGNLRAIPTTPPKMRLSTTPAPAAAAAAAALLLLSPAVVSAASWGCEYVENGLKYDFKELSGKHELYHVEDRFPHKRNTTWQINPCGPLQKTKEDHPKDQCPAGTYICGLVRFVDDEGKSTLEEIIPVAGDVDTSHKLDVEAKRFDEDGVNGLRVIYNGGKYGDHEQRAVVRFVCDMERTGLEGTPTLDGGSEGKEGQKERRDEGKDKDEKDPSLKFVSYQYNEGAGKDELRLDWKTRLACEEYVRNKDKNGGDPNSSSSWGFFTWVFVL